MTHKIIKLFLTFVFSVVIFGCGGGGSTSPVTKPVSTLSFPVLANFQEQLVNIGTTNFNVTGSCSGSANFVTSTPISTTFQGQAALSTTSTRSLNFYCPNIALTNPTNYYDSNFKLLGYTSSAGHGVVVASTALPTSVRVGDSANYASVDISKNNSYGQYGVYGSDNISYLIEPDTSNTAILNIITKGYSWECVNRPDCPNSLLFTQQTRYRLNASGNLTLISIEIQFSTTSSMYFLFNRI